ncbi:MAG: class I SAM-dependent methyltransferase [Burkholderiales bacterium]|nr:class I SAM-dependent methyltransferase [Burkholderiales bacterium]
MTSAHALEHEDQPRLLAVIASYGERNVELLKSIIADYRAMALDVHIVVLSNVPKDLGPDVEVAVGLPSENPWSLPFAHKAVFARDVDQYDLFAYSEDDMAVTERNIRAFMRASEELAPDEIAGFLRYEVDASGAWSLPDVHGGYRWRPESARRRGSHTIAEFTNEHAAFFLLTQAQLRAMVAADGFVREPYEGRYDMLCTAATDPYTSYGMRKVICVSEIDDFLIHHRSNRYAGKVGVSLATLRDQIRALMDVADGRRPASTPFAAESRWPHSAWAKNLYEQPSADVLAMVPRDARTILSVGCGWGATEAQLLARHAAVTVIPIDAIVGAVASDRGLDVACGSFDECVARLGNRTFDCVIINDLLHLLPDPRQLVEHCSRFVRAGGTLVAGGPNFGSLRVLAKRALNRGGYRKLRSFHDGGINAVGPSTLKRYLKTSGLEVAAVRWPNAPPIPEIEGKLGRWGAAAWVLQARRQTGYRA